MASKILAASACAVPQENPPRTSETPDPKKPRRVRARGQRGSIFKRGRSWVIVYRTNERKQKFETHDTKDGAIARLNEVIRLIKENRFIDAKPALFSAFTADWLARRQTSMKPGAWRTYKSALSKWLVPEFGEYEMREITRAQVKQFARKMLEEKLCGKSVKSLLTLLHGIFEDALDSELCTGNPAHKLKVDFPDDSVERVVPQKSDLLATLHQLAATPILQALLATAALTGLRRGELCALRWSNVDFRARTISVEHSLVRLHKDRAGSFNKKNLEWVGTNVFALVKPKSKRSRRVISMPPVLDGLLQQMRAISVDANPYVFQAENGGPLELDSISEALHEAQVAAGVKRFGLHGVRHFFASALHEAGASLAQARDHMGHSNITMTSHYTHALEGGREYVAILGEDFSYVSKMLAEPTSGTEALAGKR